MKAKAELVAFIEVAAECAENSAERGGAWTRYNETEALWLKELALEVAALPDEDPRFARAMQHVRDSTEIDGSSRLDAILCSPGIHPNASPSLPDAEELLDSLQDEEEGE